MAESATVLFKIMPKMQYRPVAGPYRYAPASTMPRSLTIRARPTGIEVYLFKIIATMSVPPVDAPMLKTIAAPTADKMTA